MIGETVMDVAEEMRLYADHLQKNGYVNISARVRDFCIRIAIAYALREIEEDEKKQGGAE